MRIARRFNAGKVGIAISPEEGVKKLIFDSGEWGITWLPVSAPLANLSTVGVARRSSGSHSCSLWATVPLIFLI